MTMLSAMPDAEGRKVQIALLSKCLKLELKNCSDVLKSLDAQNVDEDDEEDEHVEELKLDEDEEEDIGLHLDRFNMLDENEDQEQKEEQKEEQEKEHLPAFEQL